MPKLVLITGGSRGIGSSLVEHFVQAGYRVAFTYNQSREKASAIELASNGMARAFRLDQASPESVLLCINEVKLMFGDAPDILINNGAIAQEKPFLDITANDFELMINTNLRGPFLLSQQCIPSMILRGWGRIINISSIGGQWGGFNQVHYAAAKAGLINLTQSIAKIYSSYGITSNAIAIGLVETEMTMKELSSDAGKSKVAAIPCQRLGTGSDIAEMALFLASPKSGYITGQTLNANGGLYFG
jgi:Dehydrogenases with different specificities (related to short-chain alcohol dehydrogenases)